MARQVYFDPFGAYTGGYQRGVQQEAGLQQELRNARDSDYKFNVTNPLELAKLQREDAVGVAAQPYRLRLPELGYRNAVVETAGNELGLGQNLAQYGLIGPQIQNLQRITGYDVVANPEDGTYQFSQGGVPMGGNLGIQQVLQADPTFRKEQHGYQTDYFNQGINAGELGVAQQNARTAEAAARANAETGYYNAQTRDEIGDRRYGPGAGGSGIPSWLDFGNRGPGTVGGYLFGDPGAGQPAPPQYVQSPRPAQPIPGQTNTSQQLVDWMRAANPHAPAITSAQWDAMGPAGQEAYKRDHFPQLINAGYGAPATTDPNNYNPYTVYGAP